MVTPGGFDLKPLCQGYSVLLIYLKDCVPLFC